MRTSIRILAALWLTALLAALPQVTQAQDYPTRPITLIVPFPPGGSTTVMARNVADKMSDLLGQQIVVDPVEPALADRAGGLQLLDCARAALQAQHARAPRDRSAGDDHKLIAAGPSRRDGGADPRQEVRAQIALVVGDDRRSELDHGASHCGRRLAPRNSRETPSKLPASLQGPPIRVLDTAWATLDPKEWT